MMQLFILNIDNGCVVMYLSRNVDIYDEMRRYWNFGKHSPKMRQVAQVLQVPRY